MNIDRIVWLVTPAGLAHATYPLTIASWCGAQLHVVSEERHTSFAKVVLQQAENVKVRALPMTVTEVSSSSVDRLMLELKGDLLVLALPLAQKLWSNPPKTDYPVYILNRTMASSRHIASVILGENEFIDQKIKQLTLSVSLAGALDSAVYLTHLMTTQHFLLGDPEKIVQETIALSTRKLEAAAAEIAEMIHEFNGEATFHQRVFSGGYRKKLTDLIHEGKIHCVVLNHRVLKFLELDWPFVREEMPCSILILKNMKKS